MPKTNLDTQSRALYDPNKPYESFVKRGSADIPPVGVAGRSTRLDMNWSGRRIEVKYAPDASETMVFYPTSTEMSVYLSRVWFRATDEAELGDVLPYGAWGQPVQHDLPGWYQCQEIKPHRTWFGYTDDLYPRVNQSEVACGWRDLNLGTANHFCRRGGPDAPHDAARIPQQLVLSRVAYCAEVMLFANRALQRKPDEDPLVYAPSRYMRWYWPLEWTTGTPNAAREGKLRYCSHLCHNKFCISRHHIVVEPSCVNQSRQFSTARCPGYTVVNESPTNGRVRVLSYYCMHKWGCRCITVTRKRPRHSDVQGDPHRRRHLVFRDGIRFTNATLAQIPL